MQTLKLHLNIRGNLMNRLIASVGFVFAVGVFVLANSGTPQSANVADAEERQPGAQGKALAKDENAQAFPRLDGVYRIKRRTQNIGTENRDIYDYIAFTKGEDVYTIKGDFNVATKYGLEQPSEEFPGSTEVLPVDLKDQPAYILKWVSDSTKTRPAPRGNYKVKDGTVTFTLKEFGGPGIPVVTVSYKGQFVGQSLKLVSTWTVDGQPRKAERHYEFEPVNKAIVAKANTAIKDLKSVEKQLKVKSGWVENPGNVFDFVSLTFEEASLTVIHSQNQNGKIEIQSDLFSYKLKVDKENQIIVELGTYGTGKKSVSDLVLKIDGDELTIISGTSNLIKNRSLKGKWKPYEKK